MRKTDLLYLTLFTLIFIVLSNWYINSVIIIILQVSFVLNIGMVIYFDFKYKKIKRKLEN